MKIFCDLDGVLVDFDARVFHLTGHYPKDLPVDLMWQIVYADDDFFYKLEWMSDGKKLWNYIKKHKPEILTGLPQGKDVANQKERWCRKNLGPYVPVKVVRSKDKYKQAAINHVLIDDRMDIGYSWSENGGTFIHHRNADSTIRRLKDLGL